MIDTVKRITPLALALACAWGLGNDPAAAKWEAAYSSGTQYVVEWTQMPDFDQVRTGLPNDGYMYCVPTSAFNAMTYIARHGYPDVAPGSHNYYWWMTQSAFPTVTFDLSVMGVLMGTDAFDGTGGNGAMNGINAWLPGGFLVYHTWASGFSAPRATNLGSHMLAGQLVLPVVGWYNQDNFPVIARAGGHALTLTKLARSGDSISVSWRDPANEQSDLATQSVFQSHTYAIEPRGVIVSGYPRVMDKIAGYGSAYLDEYFAIFPMCGLTQNEDKRILKIIRPNWFSDVPFSIYQLVESPGGLINKAILHSEGLFVFLLTDDGRIWKYDQIDPQMNEIIQIDGAEDLVFSRFGKLYVLVGRTLRCYSLDDNDVPTQEAYIIVPDEADTLIADDFNDSLLLLLPAVQQIQRYDYDLTGVQETIDVMVPQLRGKGALAVSPTDGTIFVTSDESDVIYELQKMNGEYNPVPFGEGIVTMPRGLNVTDDRQVIVACDGSVKVFHELGQGWEENREHPFAGLEAGDSLSVPCSRTNYDPRIHDGPEYRNVLPEQFAPGEPDCQGDVDEDGDTDLADLAALLAAYGSFVGNPNYNVNADFDGDDDVDLTDLAFLLAYYGCGD
jgi:hypothetical protein